jgi:protein-arginine kinase activator protein McsA
MAKKITRPIPSMVVNVIGNGRPDIKALCSNEVFVKAVFKETVAGIKDAIDNKKKTAILFELDSSENFIEINKNQWIPALQTCLDKLIENEKYEECAQIKELISKIK